MAGTVRLNARFLRTFFIVLAIISFFIPAWVATQTVFCDAYVHRRIAVASWYRSWRSLPREEGLYRGTLDPNVVANQSPYPSLTRKLGCGELEGLDLAVSSFGESAECVGFPHPPLGSYETLGLSATRCMSDRVRYEPYRSLQSDLYNGSAAERWDDVDLARLQRDCRILDDGRPMATSQGDLDESEVPRESPKRPRTAVILRGWNGFRWTEDDMQNVRAMVTELAMFSGGEYELFVLLHLRNATQAVPLPGETLENVKLRYVPKALVNMTELWTYIDVETTYPKVGEHDVYYHTFMPVQLFAARHPEIDFFWNWEMDVRYTGHYGELFSALTEWASKQSTTGLWARNTRFYIPSFHGSYNGFADAAVRADVHAPAPTPWINVDDESVDGVGSEADFITLFPMFDTSNTLWPHKDYLVNYQISEVEHRYGTVGTNVRLSRKLLEMMHRENVAGRAMMSEMFPPTLAFHHGLKAVFAPHPMFLDRRWPVENLQKTFNGGNRGQVEGSMASVINHEQDFEGATWYWNSQYTLDLYRRWLGMAEEGPGSTEVSPRVPIQPPAIADSPFSGRGPMARYACRQCCFTP
ncbi:hypothetical protein LTR36_001550 [Oleoguttula mirabilis]|uniref:Uncharacterized protein n=1 Tax=Oleoguttula mirabilis TaxID=1507867 RepID=A0AAV9JN85_9PEZI|nr:hypothetical protein LTR36_001550 [Oleoguttula mirabilis]